jgi:hypothetical protein
LRRVRQNVYWKFKKKKNIYRSINSSGSGEEYIGWRIPIINPRDDHESYTVNKDSSTKYFKWKPHYTINSDIYNARNKKYIKSRCKNYRVKYLNI